jgi:hypothetical protein
MKAMRRRPFVAAPALVLRSGAMRRRVSKDDPVRTVAAAFWIILRDARFAGSSG